MLLVGAVPVFADIDSDRYCLDPGDCERRITPRTRALIPVHLGGQMADMPALEALARKHDLFLVEDSAQAIDGRWDGRASGSWGDFGSFSFQANKTITAGEGGLLTTDDPDLAEKATAYRAFGRFAAPVATTGGRSSGLMSQRLSGNYRLSEIQAAVLLAQLERFPEEDARRQENAERLTGLLAQVPGVRHVRVASEGSKHAYYYYVVRYDPECFAGRRPDVLARALAAEGIPFVPGDAVPTYRHPVFRHQDVPSCPVAEEACNRTLILRHQVLLAPGEAMGQIAEALAKVQALAGELEARPASVSA